MNVLIFGTGAIGGLYGMMLAKAGCRLSVVCRSDSEHVKANGLTLESAWGDDTLIPDAVVSDAKELDQDFDLIIVATKSLSDQNIPEKIRPCVTPKTSILLMQNGMFIEAPFQDAFPDNVILRGLAFVCVSKPRPGHIFHQDYGRIVIGQYPSGISDTVSKLSELFNSVGVPCKVDDKIQKSSWRKLIWNAPFNPLSVVGGGVNTVQMLSEPNSKKLVENVMKEVCKLAQAEGYDLGQRDIEKNIENTLTMHPYKTSMLLDHENGRAMEVDAILGNALHFAEIQQIEVPYMRSLHSALKLIESKTEATQ